MIQKSDKNIQTVNENVCTQRINFLYKAIEYTQQTVRFTDTKVGVIFLLFGIFVSMIGSGLSRFATYFCNMPLALQTIFALLIFLFIVSIGIMIYMTIMIIFPKSNPSKHIMTTPYKPKNIFYLWDIKTNWIDCFMDRKKVVLAPSFEEYLLKFNEFRDLQTIENELIYELLKISYIREIKIRRIGHMKRLILVSLLLSIALVFLHFMGLLHYM